ncbi:MAG: tetrathionate reductase subunit TtrA [Sulfurospirillum cavolei]|nr:tetrathionate reductase subunit TtrA [Sulfurospirillum cavolei]
MESSRRKFLIGTSIVTGSAALGGYSDTLKHVATLSRRGEKANDPIYGNAPQTEGLHVKGSFTPSNDFSMKPSICNGCTTHCSVRVKINRKTGHVERVFGNPYSLLSSDPWLAYKTPLSESFQATSAWKEKGLEMRSTACARGNLVYEKLNDPFRVTAPLKRVGKRGDNQWQTISIEQLIREITQGGNLFQEGYVDGLKAFADTKTLIDENNPDYGPIANKLCVLGTADEGRQNFIVHRFVQSFGTVNFMGHTSICGLSMRAGEAAYLDDFNAYPHMKPDYEHCQFMLNIATAPAQAGNPFKRQAKLLAKGRSEGNLRYVVVTPILTNSDSIASSDRSRWLPIKPSGDLAFVMGMMRVIIEEERYLKAYLAIPSETSQKALHDYSFTNASHLVVQEGENQGKILVDSKGIVHVVDAKDAKLKSAEEVLEADIAFEGDVSLEGKTYRVKSAFLLLKEAALEHPLSFYAQESGIDEQTIVHLAREFTSYGRSVGVDCHGGTMHSTGFYTTYAVMMLGALVGNLNYKGGMSTGGGKFKDFNGSVYNLLAYAGKQKPFGTRLDRARKAYETSSEYKQKVARGENPYPAKDAWFPFTNAIESEVIHSSASAYPYKMGALISWCSNFMYGQSGAEHLIPLLKDPKKAVPLFIAIDPFINETSRYADYIVPDSVLYETWGVVSPWAAHLTKTSHVRYPIVASPNAKLQNGEPISMDSFLIELGKSLNLAGFGANAINGTNAKFTLERPEDFYLRAFENIAMDGAAPAPEISEEEIALAGLEEYVVPLKRICGENWKRVAYVMSRGGRFADKSSAYEGNKMTKSYTKAIAVYNQTVGTSHHALTGELYSGVPRYYAPRLANGEKLKLNTPEYPFLAFSYKSNVLSSATSALEALRDTRYTSYIDLNAKTAQQLGITHGEAVRVRSLDGTIEGICRVKEGIHPLSIGIEHGSGREGEGAIDVKIDSVLKQGRIARRSGVNINKLGLRDITRLNMPTLSDFAVGSNARQAVPVRIEKI